MAYRSSLAYTLPYLDPALDPSHPANNIPPVDQDPYAPLSPRQLRLRQEALLAKALASYTPPHVIRSYEADSYRRKKREEILTFRLPVDDYGPTGLPTALLLAREAFASRQSPYDSSPSRRMASTYDAVDDPLHNDFRQFAVHTLHLGYSRFHPSTSPIEEFPPPEVTSERVDPPDLEEAEICWIMEYAEHTCKTIRRQLARLLGVYPAVTDPETTAYDPEIAFRYERRLHARCHRKTRRCVRPSHIQLFTASGELVP